MATPVLAEVPRLRAEGLTWQAVDDQYSRTQLVLIEAPRNLQARRTWGYRELRALFAGMAPESPGAAQLSPLTQLAPASAYMEKTWCIENGIVELHSPEQLLGGANAVDGDAIDAGHDQCWYVSFLLQHNAALQQHLEERLPPGPPRRPGTSHSDCFWFFAGRNVGDGDQRSASAEGDDTASTSTFAASSPPITGRPEHVDAVKNDGTWHVQLRGRKEWLLRPCAGAPGWSADGREASPRIAVPQGPVPPLAGTSGKVDIDTDGEARLVVNVREGDILLVNTALWFHATRIPSTAGATEQLSLSYARDFFYGPRQQQVTQRMTHDTDTGNDSADLQPHSAVDARGEAGVAADAPSTHMRNVDGPWSPRPLDRGAVVVRETPLAAVPCAISAATSSEAASATAGLASLPAPPTQMQPPLPFVSCSNPSCGCAALPLSLQLHVAVGSLSLRDAAAVVRGETGDKRKRSALLNSLPKPQSADVDEAETDAVDGGTVVVPSLGANEPLVFCSCSCSEQALGEFGRTACALATAHTSRADHTGDSNGGNVADPLHKLLTCIRQADSHSNVLGLACVIASAALTHTSDNTGSRARRIASFLQPVLAMRADKRRWWDVAAREEGVASEGCGQPGASLAARASQCRQVAYDIWGALLDSCVSEAPAEANVNAAAQRRALRSALRFELFAALLATVQERAWALPAGTAPSPLALYCTGLPSCPPSVQLAAAQALSPLLVLEPDVAAVVDLATGQKRGNGAGANEADSEEMLSAAITALAEYAQGGIDCATQSASDSGDDSGGSHCEEQADEEDAEDKASEGEDEDEADAELFPSFAGLALYNVAGALPMCDDPNCEVVFTGPGLTVEVRTLRPIAAGETFTLASADAAPPHDEDDACSSTENHADDGVVPRQDKTRKCNDAEPSPQHRAKRSNHG